MESLSDLIKRLGGSDADVEAASQICATREAEGRKQGALKLWAKISVAVGLWLPAFNSKPEEAKAAKELIRVMTHEWDDYLKALTDTQGDTNGN